MAGFKVTTEDWGSPPQSSTPGLIGTVRGVIATGRMETGIYKVRPGPSAWILTDRAARHEALAVSPIGELRAQVQDRGSVNLRTWLRLVQHEGDVLQGQIFVKGEIQDQTLAFG
jgi:hypothetical protein